MVTGFDTEEEFQGTTHLVLCSPFGFFLVCAPCYWQLASWRAVEFRRQKAFKWSVLCAVCTRNAVATVPP